MEKIEKYDKEIAKRFFYFRCKYISDNQIKASKLLGCSQPTVARMDTGVSTFSVKVMDALVNKFNINMNWLMTGEGDERITDEDKKRFNIHDITQIKVDMKQMLKEVDKLQRNYSYTVNKMNERVELQDKRIDRLDDLKHELEIIISDLKLKGVTV